MTLYLRILSYIKPYLTRLILAAICTAMAAAGNLYVPWIIKDVIDQVFSQKDSGLLNLIALGIMAIFFARGIFYYGQSYLMSYVGERVVIDIRGAVYRKMQQLSTSFYDKNKLGTIMSYVTNDVSALQSAMVQNTIDMITESCVLIGSVCAMVYLDWKLTLFTFCTFPVVLLLMNIFGKKIRVAGYNIQECTADITSILQETLSSARIIKSFVREEYEIERFEKENKANFEANMKNAKLMATLTPVIEFVAALGVTAIIWVGGRNVIHGDLTAGALIAFLVYAVNISNPIKRLTRVVGSIQKALAAAQRVFYILDLEDGIKDKPHAIILPKVQGAVNFMNVDFAYNKGEGVLKNVSFQVEPGEMVALVEIGRAHV